MRRSDKEIKDRQEIDRVIAACEVLRVGLSLDGQPYIVPVSFGYDGSAFYFHTASAGHKLEIIAKNPRACFELEHGVSLVRHPSLPCEWTFSYRSIMGTGVVTELVEQAEKGEALVRIMRQYAPGEWHFTEEQMAGIRLWRLSVDTISGKESHQVVQR